MSCATSEKAPCCCECCGCRWLRKFHQDGLDDFGHKGRLKVTLEGPANGVFTLYPIETPENPNEQCLLWKGIWGGLEPHNDPCPILLMDIHFWCRIGTRQNDFGFLQEDTSADCAVLPPVEVSADCGPPLRVVYKSQIISITEHCLCGGGELTWTIENLDPFP